MVLILTLPSNYGYVALVAAGGCLLTTVQGLLAGQARKSAKIAYPQPYAEKAETEASSEALIFNCAQRAHQNTLENFPAFLYTLLFAGTKHSRLAASLGALWIVGRVFYTRGYLTGNPKARVAGGIPSSLALIGLLGTSIWTAVEILQSTKFEW